MASSVPAFATDLLSKRGGREANEDSCDHAEAGNAGCWVVADGLGGHHGGKAASSIVVDTVLASFRANPECSTGALTEHLHAAQSELVRWQKKDPTLAGMRSTAVVAITDSRRLLWGHIGDSRFYGFDESGLAHQTEDHSVPQMLVKAGRISAEDARHHPDRNRLLQSLGNEARGEPTIQQAATPIYRGTAILLCTDGFWEHVTETEMLADLTKSVAPADWLAHMEARLLQRAPEDRDNYTAVAVFFSSSMVPPPRRLAGAPAVRRRMPTVVALVFIALCFAALTFAAANSPRVRAWSRVLIGKAVVGAPPNTPPDRPAGSGNVDQPRQ